MSVITDKQRCNACANLPEPLCVMNCPGDLMTIGPDAKSCIRSPRDCWDCMVCVKACPRQALHTRLPFQLANYGAKLMPKVKKDSIEWTLTTASGVVEKFEVKTKEF